MPAEGALLIVEAISSASLLWWALWPRCCPCWWLLALHQGVGAATVPTLHLCPLLWAEVWIHQRKLYIAQRRPHQITPTKVALMLARQSSSACSTITSAFGSVARVASSIASVIKSIKVGVIISRQQRSTFLAQQWAKYRAVGNRAATYSRAGIVPSASHPQPLDCPLHHRWAPALPALIGADTGSLQRHTDLPQ